MSRYFDLVLHYVLLQTVDGTRR